MNYKAVESWVRGYTPYIEPQPAANSNAVVNCNWNALSEQLLQQWDRITFSELEQTGHNRGRIARLIQLKYGVAADMAENYLRNFERTLPLLGVSSQKMLRL